MKPLFWLLFDTCIIKINAYETVQFRGEASSDSQTAGHLDVA